MKKARFRMTCINSMYLLVFKKKEKEKEDASDAYAYTGVLVQAQHILAR